MKRPRKPLALEGAPGKYDERNSLNDLTGKEWLLLTKSYWETSPTKDDKTAYSHPAPFMVGDVMKLISLFTKRGMTVLDPFAGSGSALIAASNLGRKAIGVELYPEFADMAHKRLEGRETDYRIEVGDSLTIVPNLEQVDYIVTSPPYHNILHNNGKGIRHNIGRDYRVGPRDGVRAYGGKKGDLGNLSSYNIFLKSLSKIMDECFRKLRAGKYCSLILSDFTVDKVEMCVQADIVKMMLKIGFEFCGTTILLQPVKPLFPFGYPYAYKINHHHQNIMNFRRPKVI